MAIATEVGNFRHCVQVQSSQAISDKRLDDGSVADNYEDFTTYWMEKNPKRGRSVFPADRVDDEVSLVFRCWYNENFVPNMRAIYRDQVYNIKAVLPDNEDKFMLLEFVLVEFEPTGDNS